MNFSGKPNFVSEAAGPRPPATTPNRLGRATSALAIVSVFTIAAVLGCGKKTDAPKATESTAPSASASGPELPSEEGVRKLLDRYASVGSCMERLPLILHSAANKDALKGYYEGKKACKRKYEKIDTSSCAEFDDGYCYPVVNWGKSKNGLGQEIDDSDTYCVAATPDGLRIDWRCSVGFNAEPLATFKAQHASDAPAIYRVGAKISDYYNFEFGYAGKTHYSFKLTDASGESLHGYLKRSSDEGKRLFDKLKDARSHGVLLELAYSKRSQDPSVVEIRRVIGFGQRERPEEYGEVSAAPSASASASSTSSASSSPSSVPAPAPTPAPAARPSPASKPAASGDGFKMDSY